MKKQNLIIACPKGRLEEKVVKFLSERGLRIEEAFFNDSVRKLTFDTNLNEIKVIKLKPSDIRSYIMLGAADIGFVGYDEILENSDQNIVLLKKTNIGKCRISIASNKKIPVQITGRKKTCYSIWKKMQRKKELWRAR